MYKIRVHIAGEILETGWVSGRVVEFKSRTLSVLRKKLQKQGLVVFGKMKGSIRIQDIAGNWHIGHIV